MRNDRKIKINDTPSLTNSDVSISEKDLNAFLEGVAEGKRTFVNLLKYIKLAVSLNFGEVLSVLIASILLPFFQLLRFSY